MRTLKMTLAVLAMLALLAGCGVVAEPVATEEVPTEAIPVITTEPEESITNPRPVPNDLFDFALLDRLFDMTFADFCREEGCTVEMEGTYGGSSYCRFSKYGPAAYFWFDYYDGESYDPALDSLNAAAMDTQNLLIDRQTLTLGGMKQWLEKNEIKHTISLDDEEGPNCCFFAGRFFIVAFIENDSTGDRAIIHRIFVKPKD